jgi:NitT/TauT family transport system substrate-binding protein
MTRLSHLSRAKLLALGAAALAAPAAPAFAQTAPAPMTLRAASSSNDEVTPFLYAMESGMFKRAGIDAHIDRLPSGSTIVAGVVGGAFDIGKSSMPSLLAARGKGINLTLLSPGGEYSSEHPSFGLVIKSDSTIKSGADLNGTTAAVSAIDDLYTIAMKTWIDAHGGDSSTVKLVEVPIAVVAEAVASGRVAVGTLTQPFLKNGLDAGRVKLLGYSATAIAPHFTMTAWFAKDDFAAKNPALAAAFVRVMHDASVYSNAHHAETLPLLARFLSLQPQDIASLGERVQLGTALSPQLMKPLVDAAAKYHVVPAPVDPRDLISPVALH